MVAENLGVELDEKLEPVSVVLDEFRVRQSAGSYILHVGIEAANSPVWNRLNAFKICNGHLGSFFHRAGHGGKLTGVVGSWWCFEK